MEILTVLDVLKKFPVNKLICHNFSFSECRDCLFGLHVSRLVSSQMKPILVFYYSSGKGIVSDLQTLKISFLFFNFELLKQLTIFFQLSLLTVMENN